MIRKALYGLIGLLLAAGPVLAQKPYQPPTYVSKPQSSILEWGIGAVFLVGCLIVAFKPSKRSNLK
jgi:hypothetical protein